MQSGLRRCKPAELTRVNGEVTMENQNQESWGAIEESLTHHQEPVVPLEDHPSFLGEAWLACLWPPC